MFLHVIRADYIEGYKIRIEFNNGESGIVNLEGELWGEVFEPLRNVENFKKFHIDPELETIVWENGADLAPEFLYDTMKKAA
jgi:hypothetical protein